MTKTPRVAAVRVQILGVDDRRGSPLIVAPFLDQW
jgi:hypothetical protein